ncbi:unnamed protein product [Spirodela intermedia]|uniref:Uncharacterized protein n=1 Tax=Spirodela intermedia TaxID=51605 RepID=A0A7I8LCV1_SPIIN|nr:unnamed protein product [Spirodela intermedia]
MLLLTSSVTIHRHFLFCPFHSFLCRESFQMYKCH